MRPIQQLILFIFLLSGMALPSHAQTWDEWFRQKKTQQKYLIQQITKLQIYLGYVKKGYGVVQSGLGLISDIKSGDLTLHSLYFDHLKKVSPAVKRYEKVADMLRLYTQLLKDYKTAFARFKDAKELSPAEIDFLNQIFSNLLEQASEDMEELTDLLTDYRLEMGDAERIRRIDGLYCTLSEKYSSLFSFISKIDVLLRQRDRELQDTETLKNWYKP